MPGENEDRNFGVPDMGALGKELFGDEAATPPVSAPPPEKKPDDKSDTPPSSQGDSKPAADDGKETAAKDPGTTDAGDAGDKSGGIVDDWDDGKPKEDAADKKEDDAKLSPEDWRTKRLNVVIGERDKERQRARELEQRLAALEAGQAQRQQQQAQQAPPLNAQQPVTIEAYRTQLSQEIAQRDPEIKAIDQQLAKIQEDAKAGKYATQLEYTMAYQPLLTRRELSIERKADAYLMEVQRQQQAPVIAQQQAMQAQAQAQKQMVDEWNGRVAQSKIPDARKYQERMVKMLSDNPQALHDHILAAILTDDESDLFTAAVMSKRKNVEELENISAVYSGKPIPPKVYARLYEMKNAAREELNGAASAKAKKEAAAKLPDDVSGAPSSSEVTDAAFRKILRGPDSRRKAAEALGIDIGY